ncbi:DUF4140 domain-containing protein [Geobacter hydrogenophilus]|uniref:DUF4140 domain-containing protein n=1 Tax=Geobacter hydrogenophilus TaxID=40983 RepID=A0A9W6G3K2_9BACT|nr:DUF4140 domain-containing protein [Geobacter hydrogenophilus]MBT0892315.1 DUF4140 domain-containing protein [Geobacter hydrogenophilus]GLI39708.1 hypothetical protein GHYDROH2_32090 [Geobacter hydrogenophilus]
MRVFIAVFVLLSASACYAAGSKSITYYLDGARVDEVSVVAKGYAEILLPAASSPESLRIKPSGGNSILRVDIQDARPNPKHEKELLALAERKRRLEDRLRALAVREEIFKAAAKSQSSKAPRKTKTNPEPMETIRKGTGFAVAQLEDVYRARRDAEDGIKDVEARLTLLKKEADIGRRVVRVWVAGKGRVISSYLVPGAGWTPAYDFRLDGKGTMDVTMHALFPRPDKGTTVTVSAVPLSAAGEESPRIPVGAPFGEVLRFRCPVERESSGRLLSEGTVFSFTNNSTRPLPSGEAAVFRLGEYLGKATFNGLQPGAQGEIAVGNGVTAAQN